MERRASRRRQLERVMDAESTNPPLVAALAAIDVRMLEGKSKKGKIRKQHKSSRQNLSAASSFIHGAPRKSSELLEAAA
jgi:hypothetical protein